MKMNITVEQYRKYAVLSLKYFPPITAMIMLIHIVVTMIYTNYGIAEWICGLSFVPLLIGYLFSKALCFCKIHRLFIYYTALVYSCIQFQEIIGFGNFLVFGQLYTILLGLSLFIYFFTNLHTILNHRTIWEKKAK